MTFPVSRNIKISFFESPNITALHRYFPILSEVAGVLHSKILIFDNHTILTGANLSNDYFVNRQDRYFIIQDCEPFSDFCEDYIKSLMNGSEYLNFDGGLNPSTNFPTNTTSKVKYVEGILQQFKMFKYDNRVKVPVGYDLKMEEYFDNLHKYNNNYRHRESTEKLIEDNSISNKSDKNEFVKKLIEENVGKNYSFLKQIGAGIGQNKEKVKINNTNEEKN